MSDTLFLKPINFARSIFSSPAAFWGSKFYSDVNFENTTFNSTANFGRSKFKYETNFNFIEFLGKTSFNDSQFGGDALFQNTTFFEPLGLTRTKYDKIYIRWDYLKKGLVYDDTAYLSLMKNFKDLGYLKDCDLSYLQYRKDRRNQPEQLYVVKKVDEFLEYTYGYGVRPMNAVLWSFVFVILFGIYSAIILKKSNKFIDEYSFQWDEIKNPGPYEKMFVNDMFVDGLRFSFNLFFSGSTLSIIKPPPLPELPIRSNQARLVYNLERVYGTFFTFLLSLSILK